MRLSYLCDCAGERPNGRELEPLAEAARTQMRDFTGTDPVSCPWRAFQHPLIRDVMQAMRFFEHGNLPLAYPDPSHRLIEALGYWSATYNRCTSRLMERDRKDRENAPPPSDGPRRGRHG